MFQYNVAQRALRGWHLKEISANVLIFIQPHPYGLRLKLTKIITKWLYVGIVLALLNLKFSQVYK